MRSARSWSQSYPCVGRPQIDTRHRGRISPARGRPPPRCCRRDRARTAPSSRSRGVRLVRPPRPRARPRPAPQTFSPSTSNGAISHVSGEHLHVRHLGTPGRPGSGVRRKAIRTVACSEWVAGALIPTVVASESPTTEKLPCLHVSAGTACWLIWLDKHGMQHSAHAPC